MTDNINNEQTSKILETILDKLSVIENNQVLLNEENLKRVDEIRILARRNNALMTSDDDGKRTDNSNRKHKNSLTSDASASDSEPDEKNESKPNSFKTPATNATETGRKFMSTQRVGPPEILLAKDALRMVETLNGQDDVGVQDFNANVKFALSKCSQPEILLHFIKTEKIVGHAKRAIRHILISDFNELFTALKSNLSCEMSVESCRVKLGNCWQNNDSVQLYNQRFRHVFNELKYAIQAEHSGTIARKIILQVEEKSANKRYIMNLRDEIGLQVQSLKPDSISKAQQEALEVETWHREEHRFRIANQITKFQTRQIPAGLTKRPPPPSAMPSTGRTQRDPPNHSLPLSQRTGLVCSFCKRPGDTENQCYSKKTDQIFRRDKTQKDHRRESIMR